MTEAFRSSEHFLPPETLSGRSHLMIVSDNSAGPETIHRRTSGAQSTVAKMQSLLEDREYRVTLIYPDLFHPIAVPSGIHTRSLAFVSPTRMRSEIQKVKPDAILITSPLGPLGWATRRVCLADSLAFTSMYNTNHLDYLNIRLDHLTQGKLHIPDRAAAPVLRRVYGRGENLLVFGETSKERLNSMGIENIFVAPLGVDNTLYRPLQEHEQNAFEQYNWDKDLTILLYSGRIAVEKDVEKFLATHTPGFRKVIIGDGPRRAKLEKKYASSDTHFLGQKSGEDLAWHIRSARLTVLPSITETWGHVITESAASGTPVLAYNVQGAKDIITPNINGVLLPLDASLDSGLEPALKIDRSLCALHTSTNFKWTSFIDKLLTHLKPILWEGQKN